MYIWFDHSFQPHCGKVFSINKTAFELNVVLLHISKCKIERSNCNCQISFRTAREKRRHMLLKHSEHMYFECPSCNYVNKSQATLDNHIEYFHGIPGKEEVCDLCAKTFKCKNHLQVHRFNHENYWCDVCQCEFLGRVLFRNHMKRAHGAGFECDLCGKMCYTQGELKRHKKLHEDSTYLNAWNKSGMTFMYFYNH